MKVFVRSASPGADGGDGLQARHLKHLAQTGRHVISEDPGEADLILVTDTKSGLELARFLVLDPHVRRYWSKLFIHSEAARPFRVWPGAYTSMPRGYLNRWTSAAIGYPCWTPGALNQTVVARSKAPPAPRDPDLLYSFAGRIGHRVRRKMMRATHPSDTVMLDTSGLYHHRRKLAPELYVFQRDYVELALRSKFGLCPVGWGTSSLRLYEMMALGVAPVIVADRWVPPLGPSWEEFAVFIAERDVSRIPAILRAIESEWQERGQASWEAWEGFFAPERQFDTLVEALIALQPMARRGRVLTASLWPVTLPAMVLWKFGHWLGAKFS